MLSLLKYLDSPWEIARGYLRKDLDHIESAINSRWNSTFGGGNVLVPVAGGTGTSEVFDEGSVVFAGPLGVYQQDNARFFWDDTNHMLGIGTATPGYPLEVTGNTYINGRLYIKAGEAVQSLSSALNIRSATNADNLVIQNNGSDIYTGGPTLFYGKVGIGTTNPLGRLDVWQNTATVSDTLYLINEHAAALDVGTSVNFAFSNGTRSAAIYGAWEGAATTDGYLTFNTRGSNVIHEVMRLTSTKYVGIGITPTQILHVDATAAGTGVLFQYDSSSTVSPLTLYNNNTTNGNSSNISFRSSTSGAGATTGIEFSNIRSRVVKHDHATRSSALDFFTTKAGTEAQRMWINENGYVGIGHNPSYPLDVYGPGVDIGYVGMFQESGTTGSAYVAIQTAGTSPNSAAGFVLIQNYAPYNRWTVGLSGNGPGGDALMFYHSGTSQLWCTKNGNFLLGDIAQPSTGTQGIFFGDGTAPATLGANTAGLYANDVAGTVNMYAINEAGESTRLSFPAPQTYTPSNVTTDRSYDADAYTTDELADVLGTLIADLQARGILG